MSQSSASQIQVGSIVTYTITLNNTSPQWAFDTLLNVISDPYLQYVPGSTKLNGVAYGDPIISGSNYTYGTAGLIDIPPGTTYTLSYQKQILDGQPTQKFLEVAYISWTSIQDSNNLGVALGPVNATNGERLYSANPSVVTTAISQISATTTITASSEPASNGTFGVVGEQFEYTIVVSLPRANIPELSVQEYLPNGLLLLAPPTITYGPALSVSSASINYNLPAGSWNISWVNIVSPVYLNGTTNVTTTSDRQITLKFPAQVKNIASVFNGQVLTDISYLTFGGVSDPIPNLANNRTDGNNVTVIEPSLSVSLTQVTPVAPIQAGDIIRYTVNMNDPLSLQAFDLQVQANLNSVMTYQAGSSKINVGGTGYNAGTSVFISDPTITGSTLIWGRSQSFYNASTSLFASIALGTPIYLTFDVNVTQAITPSQSINGPVTNLTWTPVRDSNILSSYGFPLAALGTTFGERLYSANANLLSPLNGLAISGTIDITATSESSSVGTNVVVAEQVEYTIVLSLPASTITSLLLRDLIPTGLALISTPAVTFGAAITGSQPTITPSTLPMTATGTALWSFGSMVVSPSVTAANKQITVKFVGQVQNVASVFSGVKLSTNSSFVYNSATTNIPTVSNNATSILSVNVTEPSLSVSISQLTAVTTIQTGDVIRYTIKMTNIGSYQAFDLQLLTSIDVDMSYLPSTSRINIGGTGFNLATSTLIADPDITGSSLLWGRSQSIYVAATSQFGSITTQPIYLTFDLVVKQSLVPSKVH